MKRTSPRRDSADIAADPRDAIAVEEPSDPATWSDERRRLARLAGQVFNDFGEGEAWQQ